MRGENGLFVSMPARKGQDGQYREICHPITSEFARQLNAAVLEEYQAHLTQQMEESQAVPHLIEPEQTAGQEVDEPNMEPPDQGMEMCSRRRWIHSASSPSIPSIGKMGLACPPVHHELQK